RARLRPRRAPVGERDLAARTPSLHHVLAGICRHRPFEGSIGEFARTPQLAACQAQPPEAVEESHRVPPLHPRIRRGGLPEAIRLIEEITGSSDLALCKVDVSQVGISAFR